METVMMIINENRIWMFITLDIILLVVLVRQVFNLFESADRRG